MSPSVFMAELTQGTAHNHNAIPIKSPAPKCSRMTTEHSHTVQLKGTQNESCVHSACSGMVDRTAPDFPHPKLEMGRQNGANDSERSHHPPGPQRPHLLQWEAITPSEQPPEELGWQGKWRTGPIRKVTVIIIYLIRWLYILTNTCCFKVSVIPEFAIAVGEYRRCCKWLVWGHMWGSKQFHLHRLEKEGVQLQQMQETHWRKPQQLSLLGLANNMVQNWGKISEHSRRIKTRRFLASVIFPIKRR